MNTTTAPRAARRPHSTTKLSPRYRPIVDTGDGALACQVCGQWTPPSEQHGIETVESLGYVPRTDAEAMAAARRGGAVGKPFATRMTRCGECAARRAEADRLATEHWRATVVGELHYRGPAAVDAVEFALAAAAAAGRELTVRDARELRLALAHLADLGHRLRWRARFAGAAAQGVVSTTAAAIPWAHLDERQRAEALHAFASYVRARVERPAPIFPTTATACYLCGVGEVVALPSQAGNCWHAVTVRPAALGGPHGAPLTEVEVCTACHAEHAAVGSWGATLLDRLVLRAAGVEHHAGAQGVQLDNVPAWGTTGRSRANREPWQHVDLGKLADDVRAGRML